MALFETATVDISMADVFLMDEPTKNTTLQHVHVLLAEYAQKQYALVVCRLADGCSVCADPPKVLYSIGFPNEHLAFSFEQFNMRVTVSAQPQSSFYLTFEKSGDFWEFVRIVAEAHAAEELRKASIMELLQDAINTISTLRLLADSTVHDV